MPPSEIIFYPEGEAVLVRDWIVKLPPKVQIKCLAYVARLETTGHDLRRPIADYLRDGIYELRPSYQGVNYRILYFFTTRLRSTAQWSGRESLRRTGSAHL